MPALVPIIQRKLIEVISNVLNPGGYVGGYQSGYPGGVSALTGRPDNLSIGGSVHGINSTMNSIDAIGNNNAKLRRFQAEESVQRGVHERQVAARTGRSLAAKLGALWVKLHS